MRLKNHTVRLRQPSHPGSSRLAPRFAAALLAAGSVAVPLAKGGTHPWAIGGCLLVATLALIGSASEERPVPVAALFLGGLVIWAGVQLLPVPPALHALSPGARRIFETSLAPIGLYPAARAFALDPPAAAFALAQAIACTAAFVAAAMIPARGRTERIVLLGFAIAGTVVTIVVAARALTGTGTLLGPRFPFRDPNHLAGFLNLAAFATLGIALRERGPARALWLTACALMGALVFLTLSRAGIAAFALGVLLAVGLHARTRGANGPAAGPRRGSVLVGIGVLAGVGTAAFLALGPILEELRSIAAAPSDARVQLWPVALKVARDFSLVGEGRGAFETVFTGYQIEPGLYTYTHAENEWLQVLIDFGVPGGLVLIGTFAFVWLRVARRRDLTAHEVGLLAGVAAVAAHNGFDFSLEVAGVGFPFAVATGLLARRCRGVKVPVVSMRTAALIGVAVGGACLAFAPAHDLAGSDRRLEQVAVERLPAEAAAAARLRPADWGPHAAAGIRLARQGRCASAAPWLMRAMALHPTVPGPHRAMAGCLARTDAAAAKREYRLAFLFGDLGVLADAAARFPRLEDLLEIAPATPEGLRVLSEYLAHQRPADAAIVYRTLREDFDDDGAALPLASVLLRLDRFDEASLLAREHSMRHPADPRGYVTSARALIAAGKEADAIEEIQRGLVACPGAAPLLQVLVERAGAAGRWSEARRMAEQIVATAPAELAARSLLIGRTFAAQGRYADAIERAQSASAVTPENPDPLAVMAAWCEAAGRYDDGIAAMRRADAVAGAPSRERADWIRRVEQRRDEQLQRDLARRALFGTEPVR